MAVRKISAKKKCYMTGFILTNSKTKWVVQTKIAIFSRQPLVPDHLIANVSSKKLSSRLRAIHHHHHHFRKRKSLTAKQEDNISFTT